ncbi:elongation factor P 5-aminopentanone reductase [Terrihalobacillus insolitus]|uniref:elongation factor P 5-aminopentanone reductase n=1 Tax=Terrihalobacillus insolitus TaxID=2950438 RepID=UPI0023409454|nr:SDR family oxidoreductase [Terrihalobacillus insolitus]MDC3414075.1 SDR family oxidoreductase [Terrihalobacillus insolitus]
MGKTCLLVGASGGIGVAIANQLAKDGMQLVLHYNQNKEAIEQLERVLPFESVLNVMQADLSTNEGIQTFLSQTHPTYDAIVFVNGMAHNGLFQDTEEDVMDQMLSLHVKAIWMITKQFLPDMLQRKTGHILLISSIWGEVGASCEVVYSSVKGAQNTFVKALAKEVGRSGIRVNGISPGFIDTKMNRNLTEEEKKAIIEEIPLNREGLPDEVAHAVSFLMDKRSAYIHGEMMTVSGGW